MSNEQFSDCGTAYLSYEAHNKSMSYSTKTKLILLVAIMSIGPLSALRRRSVSSAMSYRPLKVMTLRITGGPRHNRVTWYYESRGTSKPFKKRQLRVLNPARINVFYWFNWLNLIGS